MTDTTTTTEEVLTGTWRLARVYGAGSHRINEMLNERSTAPIAKVTQPVADSLYLPDDFAARVVEIYDALPRAAFHSNDELDELSRSALKHAAGRCTLAAVRHLLGSRRDLAKDREWMRLG